MKREVWKSVVGHPGYEVSSLGRVRSVRRQVAEKGSGRVRVLRGRILKQRLTKGYPQVTLSNEGVHKYRYVHQLVCEAFNGARTARDTRHLDGNPQNNTPENLRWGTPTENYLDRVRHGTAVHALGPRNWAQLEAEIMRYGEPLPSGDEGAWNDFA